VRVLFSSRAQLTLLALVSLILFGIGLLPLFGGPSYEFSLACGLVVPLLATAFNAGESAALRSTPLTALHRGFGSGFGLAVVAVVVALVHGAREGFCDFWGDATFFAVGPLPGALLAGVWGGLCGALLGGWQSKAKVPVAVLLGLSAPLVGIVASLVRYYTSPIIFAFDHFVGYFSGTLYDTVVDGSGRLVTYRVGTLGWLLVAYAVAALIRRDETGALQMQWTARPVAVRFGAVGLLLALGITWAGPQLGHYQTTASIRQELGHVALSERCEVVYASGISQRDAHALARDCDAHIRQHEAYFEVAGPERTTVYLFASSGQKAHLMGARDVYIAKPWRQEIYIQASGFPHPVLGHELAHVMAGVFARGPFLVAGPAGGWIPDPGRIEGVAVAASPRQDDDLTLRQWAAAMLRLEILPPLGKIFRLGFLGENSSKAYAVAGAFIDWLKETYGVAAVRDWYGGASLETAAGKPLGELENEFRAALSQVELPDEAMGVAKARYDRPAVFGRRCPHQVDAVAMQANRALGNLDPSKARELYDAVLQMDPTNFGARVGLGSCALREGEIEQARQAYAALLGDDSLSALEREWLEERLGDVALRDGKLAAAAAHYDRARKLLVDQDDLRTLEVKRAALQGGEHAKLARRAITDLLIGDPAFGADWSTAAPALGRWSQADDKAGLADYLLGKNLYARGRWEEAAEALDVALRRELKTPLVAAEAIYTRLKVACALGQKQVVDQAAKLYAEAKGVSPGRRFTAARLAERCLGPAAAEPAAKEQQAP